MNINYFNWKRVGKRYLLTNDFGFYSYISPDTFQNLIRKQEVANDTERDDLLEKGFVFTGNTEQFIQAFSPYLSSMKSFIIHGPTLHIFVVTTACNGDCVYCQAKSDQTVKRIQMARETAEKAVRIALQSPAERLSFEFQGGEPLMNFDCIRHIIEFTEQINDEKEVSFNLVSNLTLLTDEILEFLQAHHVNISTSLDGPEWLHNCNRPYFGGRGMYADAVKKMQLLTAKEILFGAIQTTTRKSLSAAKEIVREYQCQGLHSIFLRPLTPLGMASVRRSEIGYTPQEFVRFYRECLLEIIQLNREGYEMREGHAAIFLKKILLQYSENYMELRSPCGGGVGQIAYYPDGSIYTCDEGRMLAEMGNTAFRMGSVEDDYRTLLQSTACGVICKESVIEAQPSCSQCVYQPYCGVCPVVRYAAHEEPGEFSPQDYRCAIHSGILDTLFDLLQDQANEKLFRTWIEY